MRSILALLLFALGVCTPAFSHGSFWKPPPPEPPPPPAYGGPNDGTGKHGGNTGGAPIPGAPTPSTGNPTVGVTPPPKTPNTPGTINQQELTNWSYWWYFNREPLLDLRRRFREQAKLTGSGAAGEDNTRPSDLMLKNSVLPALYVMAGPKSQDNVRLSASIALARIGTPDTEVILEVLKEVVRSKDPKVQEAAILSLGMLGEFWSIEALTSALEEDRNIRTLFGAPLSDRERAFAAYGMGVMADKAPHDGKRRMILEPLWQAIANSNEDREVRIAAANAIGLVRLDWEVDAPRDPKEKGFVPLNRTELVEELWKVYEDENDIYVRGHLPVAMARLIKGGPAEIRDLAIERYIKALDARKEPRSQDLHGLLIGLGIMGTAWGSDADIQLRATLYDQIKTQNDAHARHMALMGLANVVANSGPSLPPLTVQAEFETLLINEFADAREMDKPWLAMAAGTLGAHLKRPTPGRSLGALSPPLIAVLRAIVDDAGSPDTLSAAVLALGLSEDLDSGDTIERLFDKTHSKDVRGYAALSLGLLGQSSSMAKIEIKLDDARYEPVALEHTAIGYALLSRPRAMDSLRQRLATATSGITAAPLAVVLGRISDASSVLPLIELTKDKNQTLAVRESLALALGLIGDPLDLSWRSSLATDVNYAAWSPTLFDQAGLGVLNIN